MESKPEGFGFPRLEEYEAIILEVPFSIEEMQIALFEMNEEKALGPDNYIATFW